MTKGRKGPVGSVLRRLLWLLVVALAGFVVYQTVLTTAVRWRVEGRPQRLNVEQVETIAGIRLPLGSRLVSCQYQHGLRNRVLFAEIALQDRNLETVAKKMVPGTHLALSGQHVTEVLTRIPGLHHRPAWWPTPEDVSLAAATTQRSGTHVGPPRHLVVAIARRADPETHMFLYWSESQ